jgi:putative nucleotidyltransferase with HDIG domain
MSPLTISDVVKNIRDLPSLPAVVVELLANLDQEDTGGKMLAEKISQDQALTAKTLRLANSSFYGMQRKVTTIQQAIAILGFNSVRTLVTAAGVIGNFSDDGSSGFDFKMFWRHSIGTALCAKSMGRVRQVNQDQAFMVGLLHDIGRLVLVTRSPHHYDAVVEYRMAKDCCLLEAERAVLDLDHTMVGRALAEHWKFPLMMQKAIEDHHVPGAQEPGSLVSIVHVADAIAHGLDLTGDEEDLVPPVVNAVWNSLDLDQEVLELVFREAEMQFEEACQILVA